MSATNVLEATDIADRVSTIEGDLAATGLGKVAAIIPGGRVQDRYQRS